MYKIKVAICDDMEEFCYYIKNCIVLESDFEFVGMAHNVADCIKLCGEQHPDVLLLDMQIDNFSSGADAIVDIKAASPDTKIIILTVHNESKQIFSALINGADDYKLKTMSSEKLFESITDVYNNNTSLRPEIIKAVLDEGSRINEENRSLMYALNTVTKLTTSEYRILSDLCHGLTYADIAKKRYVEPGTIRSQVSRIMKKYNTTDIATVIQMLNDSAVFEFLDNTDK